MSAQKKSGPAVEFVVRVTQEDGTIVEKAVQTSSEMLPAPEDFDIMTKEGFLRDFDKVETFLLQARDQFTDAAFDAYMQTVKKKTNSPE